MSYYDKPQEYHDKGIDYDLYACLEYNPQNELDISDIKRVLAVWEGEHDGDDWRWILELNDGRFAFLQGGCDYTGWDCQSWATSDFASTAEEAVEYALGHIALTDKGPQDAGLGHLLNILGGDTYTKDKFKQVRDELLRQVQEGKTKTWSEGKDEEFGIVNPKE